VDAHLRQVGAELAAVVLLQPGVERGAPAAEIVELDLGQQPVLRVEPVVLDCGPGGARRSQGPAGDLS
jgi:hypothetical protein